MQDGTASRHVTVGAVGQGLRALTQFAARPSDTAVGTFR